MPNFSEDQFQSIKKSLLASGSMQIRIMSGSMEPLIATNEVLTIQPLKRSPQIFDILVFWSGKIFICHFVSHTNELTWNETEKRLTTQSLMGGGEDFPFLEKHILGVVQGKKLSWFFRLRFLWRRFRR
jgi:hypothetical protein